MDSKVALVLIDVVNAFFSPQGSFYFPETRGILEHVKALLEAARRKGVLVVHVQEGHREGHPDFEERKLPSHCFIDSFEAQAPPGLEPQEGEVVLIKRRYSAFFATDLDLLLREHRVEKLIIAGVKTNVCVRATAQDAFALGYEVYIPREAVGSNREHLHQASLEDIERYMGKVISLQEALELLR